MAIIQCDAESTRAYRDSFSGPFVVLPHPQVPLEILEAMLQARRQYERSRTPASREFRIVWDPEPTPESGIVETVETSEVSEETVGKGEASHVDAVGERTGNERGGEAGVGDGINGEQSETAVSPTPQASDSMATTATSEVTSDAARPKARKKKSETNAIPDGKAQVESLDA